ncbi:MAG: PqqD family protein [Prosthecobacter sp.]|jgi:hypothetical protein|uniref:PqqD family protein n=1 Tax=Prosthecobacter sp. TaxID=1965333 RepID=UPI0019E07471|nr:PqqD family protein [Prosthecobacter sp.]MBE2287854.1 PqqD family protein [Prosthecobacter sp.]
MNLASPPILQRQQSGQPQSAAVSAEDTSFSFRTTTWQADGFGFDATSGEFFTASPTALVVMQCLAAKMSTVQILDRLTSTFDVPRRTAERDLESFLAELTTLGLQD